MQDFETLAHLALVGHRVYISKNTSGSILCFKYDQTHCDFDLFHENETELASEYIIKNLPEMSWGFRED